jgi:amidase
MYTDNGIHPPAPATAGTIRNAADVLREAGAAIVEDCPPPIGQSTELLTGLMRGDGGAWVRRIWAKYGTTQTHPNLTWADETKGIGSRSAAEFLELTERWDRFRSEMLAFLMGDGSAQNPGYDAILCPANAYPALPHGETSNPVYRPAFSYTMTYNLTGWPAVVVRAGTSPEGLPIAAQIVARPWREDVALALAQEIENALGGWQRPPL